MTRYEFRIWLDGFVSGARRELTIQDRDIIARRRSFVRTDELKMEGETCAGCGHVFNKIDTQRIAKRENRISV